jgi:hypothetical protein
MSVIQSRFTALLSRNVDDLSHIPELTPSKARTLIDRIDAVRLFAHAYSLLGNLTDGRLLPADLLQYAFDHQLAGICIHVLDGEERGLRQMPDDELREFAARAESLGLAIHLEISSTEKADVDEVVHIARVMSVEHIRVYSRYEGVLSAVLDRIDADLGYLAELADRYDLHFYFEQHEELKSGEISRLLEAASHPRLHALFDFGNMVNASEQPLDALRTLAPHVRQVHLKGVKILPQGSGCGHRGVLQGSEEDDLPDALMLFELLMLGEEDPQVMCFALEQENHYLAPVFRTWDEDPDPFIPYRDLSTTELPPGMSHEDLLEREPRWAVDQLLHVRSLLTRLRELAECRLSAAEEPADHATSMRRRSA